MSDNLMTKVATALIDGMNSHNLDGWEKSLAENFIGDYPGARGLNKQVARAFNQAFLDAFPDLHFDVHQTIANGNTVVLQWTGGGTFAHSLQTLSGQSIPPSGTRGAIDGVFIVEIRNGQIVREQSYWDELELMAQLGAMPQAA